MEWENLRKPMEKTMEKSIKKAIADAVVKPSQKPMAAASLTTILENLCPEGCGNADSHHHDADAH